MRTALVYLSLVLLIALLAVGPSLPAGTALAQSDWYVSTTGDDTSGDGSQENPWRTIQHAIDQATDGAYQTVHVLPGTYQENVLVNKSTLTLEGESSSTVTVDGRSLGYTATMTAHDVTVRQLQIVGGSPAGVLWGNVERGYLEQCDITGNDIGVLLESLVNQTISCNEIHDNSQDGIQVRNSQLKDLILNESYSNGNAGISLLNSTKITTIYNDCYGNAYGIYVDALSHDNDIYLNDFHNNATANGYSEGYDNNWRTPEVGGRDYCYQDTVYHGYLGNYWGDYSGPDTDGDGVGDTSHQLGLEYDDDPLIESRTSYPSTCGASPPSCPPAPTPTPGPTPTATPPEETISTPSTPTGPSYGDPGELLAFCTDGAVSSLGHDVEYRFDWGDSTFSSWSSSTCAQKSWGTEDSYLIRAEARCAIHTDVVSEWSGGKVVTIGDVVVSDHPPAPPSDLVATGVSATRIDLTWQDNSDNELGFIIERKNRPLGYFHEIDSVDANIKSYSDTDVITNQEYWYRVKAWNYVESPVGPVFTISAPSNEDSATASSGGGCFIATAAYGSYLDGSVETLRSFRDGFMENCSIGSGLVSTYYSISPPMAAFIEDHPGLKPVVRAALMPSVAASAAAVDASPVMKLAIGLSMLVFAGLAAVWLRRRLASAAR